MNHKRPQNILVTGSTADIGTELIHVLGTTYRNKFNVIGGVHKHADSSALRPHCKAIVPLDYDQLATVEAALTDIDYLFFVPVHSRQRAQLAQDVIKIAKQKRIKYVVLVSLLGCESRIGVFCSQFKEIEDSFVASGIPLTILRCSPLQQNMMAMQGNFREQIGTITMPIGTGGYSPIHVKDVAKAAAALFCHPSEHYGKTYRITGPEILSGSFI